MKSVSALFLLYLLFTTSCATHQKALLNNADLLFQTENYHKAFGFYEQYEKADKHAVALLRKGICRYEVGQPDQALLDLQAALEQDGQLHEALYYAGLCCIDKAKYRDAAKFLKTYLGKTESSLTEDKKSSVKRSLLMCEKAQYAVFAREWGYLENMGRSVNTPYDEISPVQSPNYQNKYYFSSNNEVARGGLRDVNGLKDDFSGKYYFDMFAVELINGNWTSVYPFNSLQNTSRHEIIQDFNKEGSVMFYIKSGDLETGELFTDTFQLDAVQRAFPTPFQAPVFAQIGDRDIHVFKDDVLFFSSKREGGYGGYDIYVTYYKNGRWSEPVNAGPDINSPFDENGPYLTKDGTRLYFSSNRIGGLGGHDVYFSDFAEKGWLPPVNLGLPINSGRDDRDVFISSDGSQAILSSNRHGGLGGFDLYLVYWKDQIFNQLAYTEELAFLSVLQDTSEFVATPAEKSEKKVTRDYVNQPMYYTTDNDILSPSNLIILNGLTDLRSVFPEIKVQLLAHTGDKNLKEINLFFGIKRAEKAAQYLISKGFPPANISLQSAADSYPIAGKAAPGGEKFLNRIDIIISGYDRELLRINDRYPVVSDIFRAPSYDQFLDNFGKIKYRIKVGESAQMFRHDALISTDQAIVVKQDERLFYYIGEYDTYIKAKEIKSKLENSGTLNTVEIYPFYDFRKLSESEITPELITNFPDLEAYLRFGH